MYALSFTCTLCRVNVFVVDLQNSVHSLCMCYISEPKCSGGSLPDLYYSLLMLDLIMSSILTITEVHLSQDQRETTWLISDEKFNVKKQLERYRV